MNINYQIIHLILKIFSGSEWLKNLLIVITNSATIIITLITSYFILKKTELFRKISRWEIYSENLWMIKAELIKKITNEIGFMMGASTNFRKYAKERNIAEMNKYLLEIREHCRKILYDQSRFIFLDGELNQATENFITMQFDLCKNKTPDGVDKNYFANLFSEYTKILELCRKELGTKQINVKMNEEILKSNSFIGNLEKSKK